MLNSGKPDFFLTLLRGLRRLGASIKSLLQGPVVVNTMELVCGPNYTEQQAETICRAGWAVDAVHPTAHTFAKMALNLMEKITPGVRGREQARPLQPAPLATINKTAATTSPGRKRARSETPGPGPASRYEDRSTERSRKWPQIREQRRAATYDEDFFHSISSSSRGGQGQSSQSRGHRVDTGAATIRPTPRAAWPTRAEEVAATHPTTASHPPSTTRRESTWAAEDAATGAGEAGEEPAFQINGTEKASNGLPIIISPNCEYF
jgi:hypothetical protein